MDQIINMRHALAQLAGKIDWDFIDGEIAPLYSDSGRPWQEKFQLGALALAPMAQARALVRKLVLEELLASEVLFDSETAQQILQYVVSRRRPRGPRLGAGRTHVSPHKDRDRKEETKKFRQKSTFSFSFLTVGPVHPLTSGPVGGAVGENRRVNRLVYGAAASNAVTGECRSLLLTAGGGSHGGSEPKREAGKLLLVGTAGGVRLVPTLLYDMAGRQVLGQELATRVSDNSKLQDCGAL